MSAYVLPRATRNFDFIVHLKTADIDALVKHLGQGYYCDSDAIHEAFHCKTMFNIIDHASGFKADFVILKDDVYRQTEFDRRVEVDFEGMPIWMVAAKTCCCQN